MNPAYRLASIDAMRAELIPAIREGPSFYPAQPVGQGDETVMS